jgi:predicted dehydrogenase
MDALNHGLHAICEKPLALNYAQASEMAATAKKKGLITCVPFTYRYMPSTRYLKHLVDEGYLGQPYHLHMRYYAAFARDPGTYLWRFERRIAGSGALADIGSHFLHVAEWFYGEIEAVCAQLSALVKRPPNPQGQSYEQADDTAMVMLRFKNGAQGLVHASAIAYERTYEDKGYGFDQVHEWDFHGSDGTLRQVIDWDFRQRITGDRPGDGPERELTVPDRFWGDARRERVIETWEDVFRKQGFMVCEFVRAVANGQPMVPNFSDGARVQQLLDAAIESAETGCWVKTEPRSS